MVDLTSSLVSGNIGVVDNGGTNFRIGLSTPHGIQHIESYKCAGASGPAELIRKYEAEKDLKLDGCVLAVAGPVDTPQAFRFTNIAHWGTLNFDDVSRDLKTKIHLINDFAAQALATLYMDNSHFRVLQEGDNPFFPSVILRGEEPDRTGGEKSIAAIPPDHQRAVIIGPGTGLGVASMHVAENGRLVVVDSEAGHMPFAAQSADEWRLFEELKKRHGHVSYETLCSGPGLCRMYNALTDADLKSSLEICERVGKDDWKALDVLDLFSGALGRVAGAVALQQKAKGGVFIAGGLIGKLGEGFNENAFLDNFLANDLELSDNNFLRNVAVHAIECKYAGILGAHAMVQDKRKDPNEWLALLHGQ